MEKVRVEKKSFRAKHHHKKKETPHKNEEPRMMRN